MWKLVAKHSRSGCHVGKAKKKEKDMPFNCCQHTSVHISSTCLSVEPSGPRFKYRFVTPVNWKLCSIGFDARSATASQGQPEVKTSRAAITSQLLQCVYERQQLRPGKHSRFHLLARHRLLIRTQGIEQKFSTTGRLLLMDVLLLFCLLTLCCVYRMPLKMLANE